MRHSTCKGDSTKAKDDAWFTLPHSYFLKGYDQSLSLPAKAMLLVALHLKDDAWLPSEYANEWFGISPTTRAPDWRSWSTRVC